MTFCLKCSVTEISEKWEKVFSLNMALQPGFYFYLQISFPVWLNFAISAFIDESVSGISIVIGGGSIIQCFS